MQNKQKAGQNALYILISIFLSVAIWAYVDNDQGYTVTLPIEDVPVEYLGVDTVLADRGLMVMDDSDSTVSIELEGTRNLLKKLDTKKIRVQADLTTVTSTGLKSITYRVVYPSSEFNSLTERRESYTVSVNIGELYSRSVEIRCEIQGAVAEGYIAGELQLTPDIIQLRGEEQIVSAVSYAKAVLKIDNAKETISKSLDYTLYDANDQVVESANIHPTVDQVQVVLPVNVVKELPLTLDFVESPGSRFSNVAYTLEPSVISVSGDASVLINVEELVLDRFDLSTLTGEATYNYVITVPEGCENLSGITRATLKIKFKDLTTSALQAVHFDCRNIPEGKAVTILTTELPVTLRGTAGDVAAVTPENLVVVADLQDVGAASGGYTVPAEVELTTAGDVGVIGTYQIRITISDAADEPTAEPEA